MTIPHSAQSAQAASNLPASAPARYLRVLSIAGSDSGGGAGIQADLKTFSALGCFGMTAIAAITAQNTCGVRAIHAVPGDILKAQIDAVVQDIGVDAVKIGMLVATSGDRLVAAETADALVRELFPLVELITPNLDEAGWLLGQPIAGIEALDAAARQLLALGAPAVLLKGGHLPGDW
ncbi:MAG: bifunctional hydroxymethylpyrimidine kinase/phosphomethylpyrimidine kinase, partial [Comamonas sp.]